VTADELATRLQRLNRLADELEAGGHPIEDIEAEIAQVEVELEAVQ
jgi:hypothetical protein